MLTIFGEDQQHRLCDGTSRRNFLKIGALGLGGVTLPQLLQAETRSGIRKSHQAIIMIYLPGGPPQQDMFDLKMDAPSEIRGEFTPIETNVRGIQICEHLPRLAAMMDKLIPIRTISDAVDDHSNFVCFTGRSKRNQPPGGWPTFGSVVSKLLGSADPAVPPFIGLEPTMGNRALNEAGPGFLGVGHRSFCPGGNDKANMVLNGVNLDRLTDRKTLLAGFDKFRREVNSNGLMEGLDSFNQQAFGILTSSKLLDALDLQKEDKRTLERYGKGDPKPQIDAAPVMMEQFLVARRLVEAGARCVTVAFGFWDYHAKNHEHARNNLPLLDQGVSALVEDLHQRGMDKDVSVVVWGEFGRTPKINNTAGRDHWPKVTCALLAGGGMKTGQVIGATDRLGSEPTERPVAFGEVFATLYHNMGIDVNKATTTDLSGRPQYLVAGGCEPMKELI